ncbi:anthranilate synthase component I [bacterium]|nr:anthranilate synthase component I [bacterium]
MVTPALADYLDHARAGRTPPLRRRIPADLETPVSAYLKLADQGAAFLLESVERGIQVGRYSFIGLQPRLELSVRDGVTTIVEDGDRRDEPLDPAAPFARLEAALAAMRERTPDDLPGPLGAAVGYLGWEMVRHFERVPLPTAGDLGTPDARMMFPSALVVFDHVKSEIEIAVLPRAGLDGEAAYREATDRVDAVLAALRRSLPTGATPGEAACLEPARSETTQVAFEAAVERAREHILAGDAFQIVLSQRLSGRTAADPFTVYRALRILNPSPYLFFLDFGDLQLVGSSPESLVTLHGDRAQVVPIAGTRPRGDTTAADQALEAELLASDKEKAEHLMLVDLGRNDLGRVCRPGTVAPVSFQQVERYSHVMHLVSRVEGRLRADATRWDLIRSVFPAGTLSGAPKIRAMEIIGELEDRRRGPYGGAVGYLAPGGDLDLCIAIRTLVFQGDRWSAQAGAGIVADSDPTAEYEETLHKLRAVTRAVTVAEGGLES